MFVHLKSGMLFGLEQIPGILDLICSNKDGEFILNELLLIEYDPLYSFEPMIVENSFVVSFNL